LIDKEDRFQIIVSDNGAGIEKEKLDSVFSRFNQTHTGITHTGYKGTGIGLAFSIQIIKRMKGKIWAESEGQGKGSRFIIELKKGKDHYFQDDLISIKHPQYDEKIRKIRKYLFDHEIKKKTEEDKIQVFIGERNSENEYDVPAGYHNKRF
jgi:hypothetical protein